MLSTLRIRHIGVIDDALLEFGPGFTALTGETGAGKTMIVTGLTMLLGGRLDRGRTSGSSTVDGTLALAGHTELAEAMDELELDDDRWVAVNLRLPEGLSTTPEPTCADESDPECDPESPPATSDDGSPESEPEQDPGAVAEQFVAAIEENDCEAAKEVYADPSTANCADLELDDQADITFGEFKGPFGGDDSAHVIVEMLGADGEKLPQVLQTHMVNDPERGWLVEGWTA